MGNFKYVSHVANFSHTNISLSFSNITLTCHTFPHRTLHFSLKCCWWQFHDPLRMWWEKGLLKRREKKKTFHVCTNFSQSLGNVILRSSPTTCDYYKLTTISEPTSSVTAWLTKLHKLGIQCDAASLRISRLAPDSRLFPEQKLLSIIAHSSRTPAKKNYNAKDVCV